MLIELCRMKQLSKERQRGLRVMERLEKIRTDEREKVKAGKKPFFLKNSVKHTISLEEKCVFFSTFFFTNYVFLLSPNNLEISVS